MGLQDRLRPPHPPACTCVKCVEARLKRGRTPNPLPRPACSDTRTPGPALPKRAPMPDPTPRPPRFPRASPWTIWKSRTRRFMGSSLRRLAILVVIVLVLSYTGIVGVHLTNGFDFGDSLSMALKDYRVMFTCPTNAEAVWAFIDRSETEELQQQIAQERGEDIYMAACEAVISESDPERVSPDPTTAVSSTPSPVPTIPATTVSGSTLDPGTVRETLVEYMLDLINEDRAEHGLEPVVLGTNTAAQQHAEEMLSAGYLSHWNMDGLKPYMRYTLAGGYNYEAENASGPLYYTDPDWLLHQDILYLLKQTQEGLMNSPGHRSNILDKWHKKVNIGIAFNDATDVVVQQFEGDYITFARLPSISGGVLSFAGNTLNGLIFEGVQIWYDQLPEPLTLGQLGPTYCYTSGTPVVFLRPPLPPDSFYTEDESEYSWSTCTNPYDVPPNTSPPSEQSDTTPGSTVLLDEAGIVQWHTAETWNMNGFSFAVDADLTTYLSENGNGVYTVVIWAEKGSESIPISNYSIFVE